MDEPEVPIDAEGSNTDPDSEESRNPELLADGTHVYRVVDVSIPAHGVNGNGIGEIRWHPDTGLQVQVEAMAEQTLPDLGAILGRLNQPSASSAGAGAVREPSRDPQLVGRILGTGDAIQVFELAANLERQSQSGTAGFSMETIITGTAVAATVRIERDSDLSFWHETIGERRLLIPDLWMHQWSKQDTVEWKCGDALRSALRSSTPLSTSPRLTIFSATKLPADRYASWLVFEPSLIPEGERDWYTPDACLAARGLLSFLTGKQLPFLWMDRFLEDSHLTRTYFGTAKVDDFRQEEQGYQPVPFRSLQHGGSVVAVLPSLFERYMKLREWFDLDWIIGPLWYATTARLDDKLGLASVSLERFSTAHDAFLKANPDQKRQKIKFLTKAQSKTLRGELIDAVAAFAKEREFDLSASRSADVNSIIDKTVDAVARLDDSLFPAEALESLRAKMRNAVDVADKAEKIKLDESKESIIGKRIDGFAAKTNPDKLIEAIEFDGLSVSDVELEAVMKRNDCLHGRRTLLDATNLSGINEEVARFDTLRTLINKATLARLGYRDQYVDYAARPPQRQFPVKILSYELTDRGVED